MLTLSDLGGSYDAIYSLGHNCLPGVQMTRSGLRLYSGPIDWMGSPHLSGVSRALQDRFAHFMELENMSIVGIDPNAGCYLVKDQAYGIVSNHDFPASHPDTPYALLPYPEFKAKMKRRTERMLHKIGRAERMLFIRTEGSFPELYELQQVLGKMVRGKFNILYVQHGPAAGIEELGWRIPHACALQIPQVADLFHDNDVYWRQILSGMSHR